MIGNDPDVLPESRGPYHLIRRVGGGRVHEVYEAERIGTAGFCRRAALKFLRAPLRTDPEANAAFEREACLVADANHPNIVLAHAFEEDEQGRFLVMEYLSGPDLGTLIAEAPVGLSVGAALFVLGEVLEGLAYLHELQPAVVHGNLVADNILLCTSGSVKVSDFGQAVTLHPPSPNSVPEGPSPQLDLAHAGALLERMLTGPQHRRGFRSELPPGLQVLTHKARLSEHHGGFVGAGSFRQAVFETLEKLAPGFAGRDLAAELQRLIRQVVRDPRGESPVPYDSASLPPAVGTAPGMGEPSLMETGDVLIQAPHRSPLPPPPSPSAPLFPGSDDLTVPDLGPSPHRPPEYRQPPFNHPTAGTELARSFRSYGLGQGQTERSSHPPGGSFFLRDAPGLAPRGPLEPADLFEAIARSNRSGEISVDGRRWLEVDAWLELLGEQLVPFHNVLPPGQITGELATRSLLALSAQLVRAKATGRLTLLRPIHSSFERIEIHLQEGTLAAAFSNRRTTESWVRLLGRRSDCDEDLCEAVDQVCRTRKPLALDVHKAVPLQVARNRRIRTVLRDAARWTTGRFVFDACATPVVHSKLVLLPALVEALRDACPEQTLDGPRVSFRERRLILAERHIAGLAELGLSIPRHFDAVHFGDGQTWEESLSACKSRQARQNGMLLGYALTQLGLLRPASATHGA